MINNCTWTWTTLNGVNGYNVVGPNGNSIFLPAAGLRYDSSFETAYVGGNYWSSSLTEHASYARHMYFSSSGVILSGGGGSRYYGHSVRPVCPNPDFIRATSIQITGEKTQLAPSETLQLSATIAPSDATNASVTWSSSNPSVATVSADGLVTAVAAGSATITATANDGSGVRAEYEISVTDPYNGHEYVDLGLSVKWATENLPSFYGGPVAPGESYTYNGITSSRKRMPLSKDPAHKAWGGEWRTPTLEEMNELVNNCTWTKSSAGGKYLYTITSKVNSNKLYLYSLGGYDSSGSFCVDAFGVPMLFYWTSTISYCLGGWNQDHYCGSQSSNSSFPIRPVCP